MKMSTRACLITATLGLAACSGGGSDGSASVSDPPTSTTDAPASDTTTPTDEAVADTTVAPTTTAAPEIVVPLGARWTGPTSATAAVPQSSVQRLFAIDESLWMVGSRWNTSFVLRSDDAGATWTEVVITAPPSSGRSDIAEIVRGPNGRYVASGSRSSDCTVNEDVGGGYRAVGVCQRIRPLIHVSDDGVTWRQVEPPEMAPVPGGSMRLSSLISTADGFLATGVSRSTDWFTVIWSSPDGENWTRVREIRESAPLSPTQLLSDGDTIVLLAEEHPCSTPSDNRLAAGWSLGVGWARHARIYSGPTPQDLALQTSADHPLAPAPSTADCAIGELEYAAIPYPQLLGAMVGDQIVIMEDFVSDEERAMVAAADEADEEIDMDTIGSRRLARLVDGSWETIEIDGVRSGLDGDPMVALLDVDGEPGIMEADSGRQVQIQFAPILRGADGDYTQVSAERPVIGGRAAAAAWVDGTLVVAGTSRQRPFETTIDPLDPVEIDVWRSIETTGDRSDACVLEPGGLCQFADLSMVAGYPDFGGLDLTGVDLSFSDLGAADFSGANFTDATLWGVTTDANSGSTFAGADFTRAQADAATLTDVSGAVFVGASLIATDLVDATGADFSGAALGRADIADATGAVFTGATLRNTTLGFTALPDLSGADIGGVDLEPLPDPETGVRSISLVGVDLTNAEVQGKSDNERLLITDLSGATLDGTSFYAVDLSMIDPASVDLTDVQVWDNSICPDGLPPTDGPIGTCVRS